MRFKFLGFIAAFALVAACESAPEDSAAASGAGASKPSTSMTKSSLPTPGSQEDLVVNVGDRVFFNLDKFTIKGTAQETLKKQAAWLKKYPSVTVTIEGHADERGTREYNLALGDRRANAVKDYLVALGISAGRVKVISYGKERPVALGSSETAWAQNRRGVTKVTGGASG